jgi:membrane protein required for colicin V production
MPSWQDLSWIDWTLLAVVGVSIVIGLVRGLVFECLSLAGWLVAWFGAQWAVPLLAPHVPLGAPGSSLNLGVSFGLAFVGALVAWGLLAKLIRMLIHATPLSIPDRLFGAVFGALRGGVLLLAVASVVALTPAAQSTSWQGSHGGRWLRQALHALRPLLPADVASRLPA